MRQIIWLFAGIFLMAGPVNGAENPIRVKQAEIEMAASLRVRELAVSIQEKEIGRREKMLEGIRQDVEAKLIEITKLQEDVTTKLALLQERQTEDFRNLIKVYSTMSVSKLVPLLNQMGDADVARILRAMKTEQVGKIVAKMDQKKAVRISQLLGGL